MTDKPMTIEEIITYCENKVVRPADESPEYEFNYKYIRGKYDAYSDILCMLKDHQKAMTTFDGSGFVAAKFDGSALVRSKFRDFEPEEPQPFKYPVIGSEYE